MNFVYRKNVEFPFISFEFGAGGVFCSPATELCQGHQRCYVKIRGGLLKYFGQLFDANLIIEKTLFLTEVESHRAVAN